jgi:hypothetical protein
MCLSSACRESSLAIDIDLGSEIQNTSPSLLVVKGLGREGTPQSCTPPQFSLTIHGWECSTDYLSRYELPTNFKSPITVFNKVLLFVVGNMVDHGKSSIDLFQQKEPDHVVIEGHTR